MNDVLEKLRRNARFYEREAVALAEDPARRDRRNLGAKEAETIAGLLNEAVHQLADGKEAK